MKEAVSVQSSRQPSEDLLRLGWRLSPLPAEAGVQAEIVTAIERSIQETCKPRKGPLGMSIDDEWENTMPWNKFAGGRGFVLSPLCEYCRELLSLVVRATMTYTFKGCEWASNPDLHGLSYIKQLDTEISCHFCRLRWEQLSAGARERLRAGFKCKINGDVNSGLYDLNYIYSLAVGDSISVAVTISPKYTAALPRSFISLSINSATCWAIARLWLQYCAHNHKECQTLCREGEAGRLPTRLIYLGQADKWGASKMVRLTLDKVEAWSDNIPIAELPPTFKDAMEATKQLGIQYLWIDCLCIIQDSDDDWQREAAMMGNVYQNSYCNLTSVAPHASSTSGLFATRDPTSIQMCFVKMPDLFKTSTHSDGNHWFCFDKDIWNRNVAESPLFKRGWVVQEHILAPRALHFSAQQIFWECLKRRACETLPGWIPALNVNKRLSINTVSVEFGPLQKPLTDVTEQSMRKLVLWNSIVERYSVAELTFPAQDKLSALSGIAKKVGITGIYLAGIWKDGLEANLMWHRKGDVILSWPREYQAPSWSWASVNGSVSMEGVWLNESAEIVISVLDCDVVKVGLDPTGPVSDGWIRVCGPLAHVTVHNIVPERVAGWFYANQWYEALESRSFWMFPDMLPEEGKKFYALITVLHSKANVWSDLARGLLLEPTGRKMGEYYRRGIFCYRGGNFEELVQLFRSSNELLNWQEKTLEYRGKEDQSASCFPVHEITII